MWDLKAMSQRLHRMLYHDLQVPMRPELEETVWSKAAVVTTCMYLLQPVGKQELKRDSVLLSVRQQTNLTAYN